MSIEENFVFPVYIYKNILDEITKVCKKEKLEIFGYLIGNIYKWNEKNYIVIEDQLFIIGAVHSDKYSTSQIEGAAGKYEKKFQKLKHKKNNEELRIVGWWHSHPGFGPFLSSTDIHTQEFFFPESYQVALVVDPIKNELEFFTLDHNSNKKYKNLSYAIIKP
ncbi:MAG: Mov34/MPN/PAD-1 family protein [Promethearchaeota archaeon]